MKTRLLDDGRIYSSESMDEIVTTPDGYRLTDDAPYDEFDQDEEDEENIMEVDCDECGDPFNPATGEVELEYAYCGPCSAKLRDEAA